MIRRYPPIPLGSAVVVVTGGAQGVGRATAAQLHELGAIVWIGDSDIDAAEAVAHDLGPGTFAFPLDVKSRDSWHAFRDHVVALHDHIDILVNNAEIISAGPFLDEGDDLSRAVIDTNLVGLILGMRTVLPAMVADGRGHVVNVASLAGKAPIPGLSVYNASQYAAVGLTASVREEMRPAGVSVSAVLPCAVTASPPSASSLFRGLPTATPDEVAEAIIRNCFTRKPEVAVPRYTAMWDLVNAVVPGPILRTALRLLGNDRLLTSGAGVNRSRHLMPTGAGPHADFK
ncbi:SDR family NAD(P)-dependent oxidoreductase [Hoyosella rhizosphaerae]|uniref:Short chain dehydrogenase/reductase n=1 Tax=Hoyosella rhizosphaerae TaxID=1755582 RepID=A0A916XFH3_9ACTN|nr:SDR family NAD(P)-dependent oxidoreductase [Hoyosella rhizosphaerae]MBN4925938.1 SDR family NAD(P)-dependent oxidoreductase [Hoyosella rhizosphaerae]GGC66799.1 putative short chain dehydrogenase/reductase [Hoyosella rhizosphaerae]